jgi:antitoxin ParD1/3/4
MRGIICSPVAAHGIVSASGDTAMSNVKTRTISLPEADAAFLQKKVASGEYGSESEVIEAGLDALRERDEVIERWLVEEVAPTYDAAMADPGRLRSSEQVDDELREHSATFRQED